jgi:outer membrane protein TolC
MIYRLRLILIIILLAPASLQSVARQVLTLQDALNLGRINYPTVKAKAYEVESARAESSLAKRDYLPNVFLSGQQVYGTLNGQNGPLYGFGGYGVASSGLPLPEQNWNAGFGALYLANFNWELFTFGRARGRINVANAGVEVAENDLHQEQFQHQVRVASAYLNVMATQRLTNAQRRNLERAEVIQRSVSARAKGGLLPGVDSAQANAEVANAKIGLTRALDAEQEQEQQLALLIGAGDSDLQLDTALVFESPLTEVGGATDMSSHPTITFYRSLVNRSEEELKLSRKLYFPSVNLVGVFQTRASSFESQYAQDQSAFTTNYSNGIVPTRSNYLVGVGLIWNLTAITRTNAQVRSLNYRNMAARAELDLASQQVATQRKIADTKFANALQVQKEAPIQVQSATDAYTQRNALYQNGLTTLVDVTQSLYILNRAETDRDIAFINVWQALLLQAAADGDLSKFLNELNK